MTKLDIKAFNKDNLRALRPHLDADLKALSEKYGLNFSLGNAKYTDKITTYQLNIAVLGEDGTSASREAEAFTQLAKLYGFETTDLGKEFTVRGEKYKIHGLNPKAHRMPVLALNLRSGKVFKFETSGVLRALGRSDGKPVSNALNLPPIR